MAYRVHQPPLSRGSAPDPVPFRAVLEGRLADPRRARGKRHSLSSLISVLVTGMATAHYGPLAVAQAAAGWDQEILAAHGCRISPRTGLRTPPSASTLDRLPEMLDADELEAALSGCLAAMALDPAIPAAYAAHQAEQRREKEEKKKKPAAESLREEREDGWFRPHPLHPWLDPAVAGDPGHVPARQGVAVDGKERKGAKAGGRKKVHLLAAITHTPGIVIAQDKVAKSGKANEISHFKPLLAPLPLAGTVVTSDAGEPGQRPVPAHGQGRALPVARPGQPAEPERAAHRPALGNDPGRRRDQPDRRGRIETRTIRVLPAPAAPASPAPGRPSSSSGTPPARGKAAGTPPARPSSTSPASPQTKPARKTSSPTSAATGGPSTPTGYAT
jgi:hypothetical protein